MTGPSTQQLPQSRAETALGGGPTDLINQILGGQGNLLENLQNILGNFGAQPSALNQQLGQTLGQLTDPNRQTAAQQTFNVALPQVQQQLAGGFGQDILSAATPIFNRNLQQAADITRQSGPRFAGSTQRLVSEQGGRAVQDFNLFSQNVLESGRARQLQALDVLGRLGSGADVSQLGLLQTAGQFGLGQQQLGQQGLNTQAQLLQQILGAGFFGGGVTRTPGFEQRPGSFGQIVGGIGTLGALAAAIPTGGASLAALPATTGALAGGGGNQITSQFNPPQFGSSAFG